MTASERVKKIRLHLGYDKQGQFADDLGIRRTVLTDIERGKTNPGLPLLEKLHQKWNVNLTYVIAGKGKMFIGEESNKSEQKDEITTMESTTELRVALESCQRDKERLWGEIEDHKKDKERAWQEVEYLRNEVNRLREKEAS